VPQLPWYIDEPQIEDVLKQHFARVRAYGKIVVVDDLKLQDASAQAAAELDARVDRPRDPTVRHLPKVRLEQDVFSLWHPSGARVHLSCLILVMHGG
jgi:hypothetical protein